MKRLLPLCLILSWLGVRSQNIDFGIVAGTTLYSGDLSPRQFGYYFEDFGLALGPFARFQFNPVLGIRAGITFGQVSADDLRGGNLNRRLNFHSNILEVSGIAEISPFNLGYYSSKVVIVPYLNLGVSIFNFDPKINWQGQEIRLRPLGTEGQGIEGYPAPYSRMQLAVPFGIGLKLVFNDTWTLGAESASRLLFTDYLDDVGAQLVRYGDVAELNGELAAQISNPNIPFSPESYNRVYRRGGDYKDWFHMIVITLSYRLDSEDLIYKPGKKGVVCPRW